jgi:phosphoribosylanthranilate isomerase
MFLKVCGITRLADARHAAEQGATALGFVFWPASPRYITPDGAAAIIAKLSPTVAFVGVFVNEPVESIRAIVTHAGLTAVQLHGDEAPTYAEALGWPILRAQQLDDLDEWTWPPETTLLLDAIDPARRGGTGTVVDWGRAAHIARKQRVVLAGGLTPDNVAEAIETVRPFGVDVSSGIEQAPGIKDAAKVARFLSNARAAFQQVDSGQWAVGGLSERRGSGI